jgi:hypothetical protein
MYYYNYPLTIHRVNRNLDLIDEISFKLANTEVSETTLELLAYKKLLLKEVYSLNQTLIKK